MTGTPKIPSHWHSLLLGEVAAVVAGGTPRASDHDNFSAPGTQVAWLTPADLSKYTQKYIAHGARDLSAKGYETSSAKLMPAGTILFSSRAPIGYVAIAENQISTNQGFKNFVLPTYIDPSYAYYFLRSVRHIAESMGTGTTFKEVSGKKAKELPFTLAPLEEQKVIADRLDTLLAQVESIKARLEHVPQILKRFRQSILAAAVSGRMTEEWRESYSYTPVDETLADIALDRTLKTRGKAKTPQPHLKQEESPIPDVWKWVSLDSLTKKIVDGAHHTPTYIDQGVPFISVKDIRGGEICFKNTKFISNHEHDELSKRCPVEKGDLLITKSGTIGRTALVKTDQPFSIFVSVALIKPANTEVNVRYIDLALQKWINEIDVSSRIVGSAIKNLHLRDMKVLAIPFAPTEEQTEIVRRVDQLLAQADHIEQQVRTALERTNNLTQSILTKAFCGELTEQWRKDNPELISGENSVAILLERIKAERAAQAPRKLMKKKTKVGISYGQ